MKHIYKEIIEDISLGDKNFSSFIEKMPVGFFVHDGKALVYANSILEKITGYKSSEMLNKNFWFIIHPDDRKLVKTHSEEILRTSGSFLSSHFSFRILTKKGQVKWVDLNAVTRNYRGKKIIFGFIYDVTTSKGYESDVIKYKFTLDQAEQMIAIADLRGKVIYANDSWVKRHGFSKAEELIGKNLSIFHSQKQLAVVDAFNKKLLKLGRFSGEVGHVTKQGQEFLTFMENFVLKIDGENYAFIGIATDITGKRKSEIALQESEYRFRTMIEKSPFSIELHDKDGVLKKTNHAWEKLWGLKSSDAVGKFNILKDKQAKEKGIDAYFRRAAKGEVVVLPDMKYDAAEAVGKGRYRWLRSTFYPINGRTKDIEYVVIVHNDITENKIAEEVLRERESLLSGINNNLQLAMIYQVAVLRDGSRKLIYASDAIKKFYGITFEQGMRNINLIYGRIIKEDRGRLSQLEEESIKGKKIFKSEARVVGPSGKIRWSSFVSVPTVMQDGTTIWNGIEFDITEQKIVEENLRNSENRYHTLVDLAVEGILVGSHDGVIIEANKQMVAMSGRKRGELVGKNIRDGLFTKESVKNNPFRFDLLQKGQTVISERDLVRPDGSIVNIEMHTKMMPDGTYQSIYLDISKRKSAEELLRSSEEKFAKAFRSSPQAQSITSLDSGLIFEINDSYIRILGFNQKESLGHTTLELGIWISSEDRLKFISDIKKYGFLRNKEMNIKNKAGIILTVLVSAELIIIEKKSYILTTFFDITERKRFDEILSEKERRYRELFETSRDAIMTLEPPSWNFTSGNLATLKMFRAKNEEIFLSYPPWKLSPKLQPDGRASDEKAKEMINLAVEKGSNLFEWTHKRISGEEFVAEVFLSRIKLGERVFLQGIVRDITEQKLAEKKIKDKNLDLIRLNKVMVGRELKMVQLKKELEQLRKKKVE